MAFWGAPLKDPDHAYHSLEAALAMQKALVKLNESFAKQGMLKLSFGIGINSGVMSVGDMGSKYRRNYTVLGDSVNLGSRIENLTKFYGINIITTSSTIENQQDFIFRKIDKVKVKGKKNYVTLYELICRKEELTEKVHHEINLSEQGLNFYFNRDWENAKEIFAELHYQHPKVKLYSIFLERIALFMRKPPPDTWDGVTNMS